MLASQGIPDSVPSKVENHEYAKEHAPGQSEQLPCRLCVTPSRGVGQLLRAFLPTRSPGGHSEGPRNLAPRPWQEGRAGNSSTLVNFPNQAPLTLPGTTAHVGIALYGVDNKSGHRHLDGENAFHRNSLDVFQIATERNLGSIWRIRIWHDNKGGAGAGMGG